MFRPACDDRLVSLREWERLTHIEGAFFINSFEMDLLPGVFGDLDPAQPEPSLSELASVLLRLVDNGWMEMRRYVRWVDGREGLAHGDPVPRDQLPVLLADPASWEYPDDPSWIGALTLVETEAGRTISRVSADEIAARDNVYACGSESCNGIHICRAAREGRTGRPARIRCNRAVAEANAGAVPMSPTSGVSARSLHFAQTLSGELAGVAEVTISETSPGISVDVVPRCDGARSVSWADFGSEIVVQVGDLGGQWEIGGDDEDLAFLEDIVRSVIAGRVSEVFAVARSRVVVTLDDGSHEAETGYEPHRLSAVAAVAQMVSQDPVLTVLVRNHAVVDRLCRRRAPCNAAERAASRRINWAGRRRDTTQPGARSLTSLVICVSCSPGSIVRSAVAVHPRLPQPGPWARTVTRNWTCPYSWRASILSSPSTDSHWRRPSQPVQCSSNRLKKSARSAKPVA